ncbi:cytochrome P450 81C13-like [Punica granatum]|uniref:Cytochrome P450 81C13-like n=1 Tax=Punica granatum TaxID=22663 RepID=A0A6P8DAU5_PUNGR|nr:cytochrome P450 81C13-like [Punica granatum]
MLSRKLPSSPLALPLLGHVRIFMRPSAACPTNGPLVEDCFTKNDIVFSIHQQLSSGKPLECGFSGLGSVPYGQCWQNLRRFSAIEIFSAARIAALASIRTEEIRLIVKELMEEGGSKKVEVKSLFYVLTFNIMIRMVDGSRYFRYFRLGELGSETIKVTDYRVHGELENIRGIFSPTLEATVCDYFPWLRWLSFHGLEKRFLRIHKRRDEFMQRMTENHRKKFPSSPSRRDEDECQSDKGGFVHKMGTT